MSNFTLDEVLAFMASERGWPCAYHWWEVNGKVPWLLPHERKIDMATAEELLKEMQEDVKKFCIEKGWYDREVPFAEAMALLHSEVSEALEAYRDNEFERFWVDHEIYTTHFMLDSQFDYGGKPKGVGSEFADILIRLLDDCERFGINLYREYLAKMEYNRTREYRHGKRNL